MSSPKQIVVLMTTHNRSSSLERALDSLQGSALVANVIVRVFISNSGAQAVRHKTPESQQIFSVHEFAVPENSFWAKGMRLAWEAFVDSKVQSDFILWLNEDTFLHKSALSTLLQVSEVSGHQSIVVGSAQSRAQGFTYGGKIRNRPWLRLHFTDVEPHETLTRTCQTFNGNCVLIPKGVDVRVGGFPRNYTHQRADLAYGLLAEEMGIDSLVAPGYLADCEENLTYPKYKDLIGMGLMARIKFFSNPKMGPLREHVAFCLRFGGVLGILYALAPIARSLIAR